MTIDFILRMDNITKDFLGFKALENVTLSVKKNDIHAICGENGAGKSTLMNVLSGVYPYGSYSGDIIYKNEKCKFKNIKDSERKGIVIIQQELALIPQLSIAENIFLGNERTNPKGIIDWTKTKNKALEMLEAVGLHNENVNLEVANIGVGKQQLIEIAKALAKKIDLLILDEPTASLNDEESENLLNIILSLKNKNITCIIISHKLKEIRYVSDSVTILRDGKTIETLKDKHDFSEEKIIMGMVGREIKNRYPKRENCEITNIALEINKWNVYDDLGKHIIKDVSLYVRAGEVVGLAGLMGSGRTEFAMSVFGKSYGNKISGEIKINGKTAGIKNVKEAIKNKIAYTSEDRKNYGLVLIEDVKHNMSMASLRDLFSKLGIINSNKEISYALKYKDKLNVKTKSINQNVGSLSGGNQQKVVLAKWMMLEPKILILDEPTRGIDVGAKYEIYTAINELVKNKAAVIVVSSEMPEIIGICDRVYVIKEGQIAGELQNGDITQVNIMKCIIKEVSKGE